jgi:hypothetical protein
LNENGLTLAQLSEQYKGLVQKQKDAEKVQEALTDAQTRAKSVIAAARTPLEVYDALIAQLTADLDAGHISLKLHTRAVEAAGLALDNAADSGKEWGKALASATANALENFIRFTTEAGASFSEFIDQTIRDLLRLTTRLAVTGLFKQLEVPGFAHGGFLQGVGIVGERGPELISAGRGGVTISPLRGRAPVGQSIGDNFTVPVTIIAADSKSFAQMAEENPDAIVAPVVKAIVRSQTLRRILRRE